MNVTLKIYYSDNVYTPALYFCDVYAAWMLWWKLTHPYDVSESGPHIVLVEIWDGEHKLEPETGFHVMLANGHQQYKSNLTD